MKKLLNAKSIELKSDLLSEQAIKLYRKTFTIKQFYRNFWRSVKTNILQVGA